MGIGIIFLASIVFANNNSFIVQDLIQIHSENATASVPMSVETENGFNLLSKVSLIGRIEFKAASISLGTLFTDTNQLHQYLKIQHCGKIVPMTGGFIQHRGGYKDFARGEDSKMTLEVNRVTLTIKNPTTSALKEITVECKGI